MFLFGRVPLTSISSSVSPKPHPNSPCDISFTVSFASFFAPALLFSTCHHFSLIPKCSFPLSTLQVSFPLLSLWCRDGHHGNCQANEGWHIGLLLGEVKRPLKGFWHRHGVAALYQTALTVLSHTCANTKCGDDTEMQLQHRAWMHIHLRSHTLSHMLSRHKEALSTRALQLRGLPMERGFKTTCGFSYKKSKLMQHWPWWGQNCAREFQ